MSPLNISAPTTSADALRRAGKFAQAETLLQQILAQHPDHAEALHHLGLLAYDTRNLPRARQYLEKSVALLPTNPDYLDALASLYVALHEHDLAADLCRRIAQLKPDSPILHTNLGRIAHFHDRSAEALAAYDRAIALCPTFPDSHLNRAQLYQRLGRLPEAEAAFRHTLQINPHSAEAAFGLATTFLAAGRFAEGWHHYEARWRLPDAGPKRHAARPPWEGQDLHGRSILVFAEQGVGDMLQFVRYAALLADRGARVVVECHESLKDLLTLCPYLHAVRATGEALPPTDFQIPVLSLPRVCQTTLETIPAPVPYLHPDTRKVQSWSRRLTLPQAPQVSSLKPHAFKVGLVWAGNPKYIRDRHRSLPLSLFLPLLQIPHVTFYSLQVGPAAAELSTLQPRPSNLLDLTATLRSFADTAACLANLDLIISVDTAVAHLAGALNRPVWNLLSNYSDWRWLLDRQDTPWYPSMRLFRQPPNSSWDSTLAQATAALATLAPP